MDQMFCDVGYEWPNTLYSLDLFGVNVTLTIFSFSFNENKQIRPIGRDLVSHTERWRLLCL